MTHNSLSISLISTVLLFPSEFLLLPKASVDNNIKCTEYKWGTGEEDLKKNKCVIS
jgi:hypothetical protein